MHTSDCCITNLYGWSPAYGIGFAEEDGLFWIGTDRREDGVMRLWMPLGDWSKVDWNHALAALPSGATLERTSIRLLDYLPEAAKALFTITRDRDNDEYIYERSALAELSGRKLHKKRNHVNAYEKLYGIDYRNLGIEDADAILGFCRKWLSDNEDGQSPSLLNEYDAIGRAIELWPQRKTMKAGALFVNSEMVAFSMGEMLDTDSFIVHFEKGIPKFRGVYQTINQCFVRNAAGEARFINREQDTGDEGLRFAKTTYNPIGFNEKIRLIKR